VDKRIFLIDGSAIAYRSYFAFIRNPLINSRGENTSAVFGFANTLRSLIRQQQPAYIMVAFDPGTPTFRHKKFPAYKATREKMPDEMRGQFPKIFSLLDAYNIKYIEKDGFEADDIIGTLAGRAAEDGFEVFIVSGDKDFAQLVDSRIKLYNIKSTSGEPDIIDSDGVKEKFGVKPKQIIDLLALMGDSSDNIPGVPQIGPKTAVKLLDSFQSLNDLYDRVNEVKPDTLKQKLLDNRDKAFLSKDLVTILTDVEIQLGIEDFRFTGPHTDRIIEFLKYEEFSSLLKDFNVTHKSEPTAYHCIKTWKDFGGFFDMLKTKTAFAFDTETDSINPLEANLLGISFAFDEKEAYYLSVVIDDNDSMQSDLFRVQTHNSAQEILSAIKPILEDESVKKCGHNIKYDALVLRKYGVYMRGIYFDTMIASYLLRPTYRQHNLDALSLFYLNFKKIPITDLIGEKKNQVSMADVPVEKVAVYSCEDADITLRLQNILIPQLSAANLTELFNTIEMPLVPVLMHMEEAGIALDTPFLKNMSRDFDEQLERVQESIFELAGESFNLNSPQQLGTILFDRLQVHKNAGYRPKKTKTGYRTDVQVLEMLSGIPIVDLIMEYRQLSKLKSTYIDVLPKLINANTGRLHTSFNQTITATGRLSSSDPNLQNIPVRTEIGKKIRKAFISSSKATKLLSADYSQIELRILAHLSKDERLIEAFSSGQDIHSKTASIIFEVPMDEVTPILRSRAKAINFGIIYGMGQAKLARDTGITQAEAKQFIESYFEKYSGIKQFIDESLDFARKNGYVLTMLNRKREIPEIHSEDSRIRVNAEHIAVNSPIQGTCADMIKIAMIHIHNRLRNMKTKMLLQIHDELLFEVPVEEIDIVKPIIADCMKNAIPLNVPVEVKTGIGDNWMEIK
jgi:DNA polymerase-1